MEPYLIDINPQYASNSTTQPTLIPRTRFHGVRSSIYFPKFVSIIVYLMTFIYINIV